MVPAPTPVSAMKTAMTNPIRYSTLRTSTACVTLLFRCLDVNAAFHFAAGPAAGARIVRIERERCARLAPDRRITACIQRQQRNSELFARVPHIRRSEVRQWAQLHNLFAAGQREQRRLFQPRT